MSVAIAVAQDPAETTLPSPKKACTVELVNKGGTDISWYVVGTHTGYSDGLANVTTGGVLEPGETRLFRYGTSKMGEHLGDIKTKVIGGVGVLDATIVADAIN